MSKIPNHATRVFKGVLFDVYQWQQELFDGSKATFEMLKRPDTVVVIPVHGDQVFYAHQEQPGQKPFLSLFGGRAEEGEEPLGVAKRELLEEAGLVSDEWKMIRHFSQPGKIEWNVYFFVARNCRIEDNQKLDAGEKITIKKTSVDDFIKTIVVDPNFSEYELRQEIQSSFNQQKAEALKVEILGGI